MQNKTLKICNPIIPNPYRIIINPLNNILLILLKLLRFDKIQNEEEIRELGDCLLLSELQRLLKGLDEDEDPVQFAQDDYELRAHGLP
jgi:hypothetical protein